MMTLEAKCARASVLEKFLGFSGRMANLQLANDIANGINDSGYGHQLFISLMIIGTYPGSTVWEDARLELERLRKDIAQEALEIKTRNEKS